MDAAVGGKLVWSLVELGSVGVVLVDGKDKNFYILRKTQ